MKTCAPISLVLLLLAAHTAWSQQSDPPADACEKLALADFSTVQDAPTQITAARSQSAEGKARCDVEGYVVPNIGFHLQMPLTDWNGKFIEVGCGGACGGYFDFLCNTPLSRGYACIASDMGHKSTTVDYKWAYQNLQAEIDWSYRSAHVVALAGKAMTERFYGSRPRHSYFHGCSTGGRQATIEAQRFPADFDGILAGAPPFSESDTLMRMLWSYRAQLDSEQKPVFTQQHLELLHRAALKACDRDDGVEDGVIGEPRICGFKPASLLCEAGQSNDCLTEPQVRAAEKIYAGPVSSSGQRLSTGGFPIGSELGWLGNISVGGPHAVEAFRFIGFMPDADVAQWNLNSFSFDSDPKRLGMMESLYGNTNPDLRKFQAAGGKLLVYHGWTDLEPSPLDSIDYYEMVTRTMGGLQSTQEFFRLFLVPGMNHCSGGDGAFAVDYLTYLENWVEKGEAPQMLLGAHVPSHKNGYDAFVQLSFPLDSSIPLSFTRPIYPYPLRARYKGRGDANSASSFVPAR